MIKKLSAVGNSLGLIIERPILELLDITKDTPLEIKTDGEALIIRPAKLGAKDRIRESTKRMMAIHDETLQKLAPESRIDKAAVAVELERIARTKG